MRDALDALRKFQNAASPGRITYVAGRTKRDKFINSRDYRRARKHRNEIAFQSRKVNRA